MVWLGLGTRITWLWLGKYHKICFGVSLKISGFAATQTAEKRNGH